MSNEPEHSERAHAVLGGSSASRWANCPGSVFYIKDLPEQVAGVQAEDGTKAHELSEKILGSFLNYKITGNQDTAFTDEVLCSSDNDPEIVEAAIGYRDAVWQNVLESAITGKAYGIEDQFVLHKQLDMRGFVDFWAVYIDDKGKRTGAIVDFKFGYKFVEAENNAQLAFYACALREEMRRYGKDLDHVKGAIYQPRVYGKPAYRETWFTGKELDKWKKKFFKAAEQIFVKQKPIFKVGTWCEYCPAAAICVKRAESLEQEASMSLAVSDVQLLPAPEKLSDEALARIVLAKDDIESFLSACKKLAIDRAKNGNVLPGTKVVQASKPKRRWIDDEEGIAAHLMSLGVESPYKNTLRALTDVEKELAKSLGKEEAKEALVPLCTQTVPSLVIVPDTDDREAISVVESLLGDTF